MYVCVCVCVCGLRRGVSIIQKKAVGRVLQYIYNLY